MMKKRLFSGAFFNFNKLFNYGFQRTATQENHWYHVHSL